MANDCTVSWRYPDKDDTHSIRFLEKSTAILIAKALAVDGQRHDIKVTQIVTTEREVDPYG